MSGSWAQSVLNRLGRTVLLLLFQGFIEKFLVGGKNRRGWCERAGGGCRQYLGL